MDRDVLRAGDEILCKRCRLWHPTYQPNPTDPRDYLASSLYFNCSDGGLFYAGRVGKELVGAPDFTNRPSQRCAAAINIQPARGTVRPGEASNEMAHPDPAAPGRRGGRASTGHLRFLTNHKRMGGAVSFSSMGHRKVTRAITNPI